MATAERATPLIVVAGFQSGFSMVQGIVAGLQCRAIWLPENFAGTLTNDRADCTLFLIERDTWCSSQLYSLFTWVEARVSAPHRFLVVLEDCLRSGSMPSVLTTEEVGVNELGTVLARVLSVRQTPL
jgi:hypothetical protein